MPYHKKRFCDNSMNDCCVSVRITELMGVDAHNDVLCVEGQGLAIPC
jgi:hypothetical protein